MPIGGFVIHIEPERKRDVLESLKHYQGSVEVHGADEKGNIVAVLDTDTAEEMEGLAAQLQHIEGVLTLGITYFDAEDEIEKMAQGEIKPTFSFGRKGEKP